MDNEAKETQKKIKEGKQAATALAEEVEKVEAKAKAEAPKVVEEPAAKPEAAKPEAEAAKPEGTAEMPPVKPAEEPAAKKEAVKKGMEAAKPAPPSVPEALGPKDIKLEKDVVEAVE